MDEKKIITGTCTTRQNEKLRNNLGAQLGIKVGAGKKKVYRGSFIGNSDGF